MTVCKYQLQRATGEACLLLGQRMDECQPFGVQVLPALDRSHVDAKAFWSFLDRLFLLLIGSLQRIWFKMSK